MKPQELTFFAKDDYAREPVPYAVRRNWFFIALVWFAAATDIVAALIGSILAEGQTVLNAIIAVVIANVILGLIGGLCSYIGSTTGLSTGFITRFAFGNIGSKIVMGIIVISFFLMFGVDVGLFGQTIQYLLQEVFGLSLPVSWAAILGGVIITTTATVGYIAIERLSIVAVPLMLILLGSLFARVAGTGNKSEWLTALPEGGITMTMGSAISFVMASWMMIVVISPDISRWAKTRKDAFLSGFIGFLIGNSVMIVLSMMMVRITGAEEIVHIFLAVGWGIFAVLTILLAQWTTLDNILYSTGLGVTSLIQKAPKYLLTLVIGISGSIVAAFQISDYFLVFTSLAGAFLSPIAAIYLVEYFFLNRNRFHYAFIQDKRIASIYWTSFISWTVATAVGILTIPSHEGGLGLLELTGAASLDSFLVAMVLHLILGKSAAVFKQKKARSVSNV